MKYLKRTWAVCDNYLFARWLNRASTAAFWYLPEPPHIDSEAKLADYFKSGSSPLFLVDYRQKLQYKLQNKDGIIVLPYLNPIGQQINPEAAFQYALGLHDAYRLTKDAHRLKQFWHYAEYFLSSQTAEGLWQYQFDWFGSKAPWHSALAQSRGACVMLRAWMLSKNSDYLMAAKSALKHFNVPTEEGGFLHCFSPADCQYFEEYPSTPTGVINGFMSSLICIWELKHWLTEAWIDNLWQMGIQSLEKMLPYYSTSWWSLYDLDEQTPVSNVNSPRYHLLEINYLKILFLLTASTVIHAELTKRQSQYKNIYFKSRAVTTKLIRKILYR